MMLRTKYKATTSVLSPSAAESARVEERETTGFRWKLTLFLFLSLVALNVYAPANPTLIQRGLASVLYVSSFIPLWLHASQKNRGIPFLPLFGMLYALYYAIPIFLLDGFAARFGFFVIQEAAIEMALWVAIIGWLSLLFAHYVWPGAFLRSGTRGFVLRWPPDSSKVWMVVVIYLGILATILKRLIPLPLALQGAVTFLETFLRFAFMGLLILQLKGYLGVGMKLFLWAGVAPLLFVMLTSSALVSQTLLLWISLILTYWTLRGGIPWRVILLGGLLIMPMWAVRDEFRNETWWGTASSSNLLERSQLNLSLATDYVLGRAEFAQDPFEKTIGRTSQHGLLNLAWVIQQTPSIVPFWNGETYSILLWTAVPRFIWPDKPRATLGQDFGHRYNLLDPTDLGTSYNMGQLIEMYANFGVTAVVVGMFLLGLIYRLMYELFGTRPDCEGTLLIGIVIFSNLIGGIDYDTQVVFGNFVITLVALVIFVRVIGFDPLRKFVQR